ncbi:MAG: tRNA lysidine(34) synthetase TilS [Planctomycetes bacterium]|nr:tRNA lysidine(34) synthetase TilS [Planctomycetota bacterium]MBI3844489.1 tRNA lysidine(34) synthetase TilS [Planctomycetota bacterium]
MRAHSEFDRVARACEARGLARRATPLVVAVSGGADSVFLLHALVRARATVHVAHLVHGLRGDAAERDAAFVEALARSLGVPVTIGRVSVPELRARHGGSIEEVARSARYAFLADVAHKIGSTRVALGHTADDQAETVLFRLLRGTGMRGLRGMPSSRAIEPGSSIRIVRPLLRVRRRAIEAALRDSGIAWCEDETNEDLSFSRNVIRRRLLPEIARGDRDPVAALLDVARDATRAQRVVDREARARAELVRRDGGPGIVVDLELLVCVRAPAVLEAFLRRVLGLVRDEAFPLRRRGVERVAALLLPDVRTGARAPLGDGTVAVREAHAVRFLVDARSPSTPCVRVNVPGETRTRAGILVAALRPAGDVPRFDDANEAAVDVDCSGDQLMLDSPRPGDRLRPLGAPGSKLLRRLFIDWKVPASRRPLVPILRTANGEIGWVVGHRIAHGWRVTSTTTRVLRLSFRER